MERRPTIAVIGAGNVATHLCPALDKVADIVQVYSRSISHAQALAVRLDHAVPTDNIHNINPLADYYLISVKDDAIPDIASNMPDTDGIIMHTSGSVGIDALKGKRTGVLYPLQTFSKEASVDVREVPFFIEGSDDATTERITALARSISDNVYHADSAQRTVLHIAAVFGCNFVNYLLGISSDILSAEGYSLAVLRPLLQVTLDKAMSMGPKAAQTGPAVRHDLSVINKHISSLDPDSAMLYETISKSIMDAYPQ